TNIHIKSNIWMMTYKVITALVFMILIECVILRDIKSLKTCKKCYKKCKKVILKSNASCLADPTPPEKECNELAECLKKYDKCAAKFCPVDSTKQCTECECTECSLDYECNNCKCKNCFGTPVPAISRDNKSLKACKKCYKKVILKSKDSCLGDPSLPEEERNKELAKCLKKYDQCAAKFCSSKTNVESVSTTVATDDSCRHLIDNPVRSAKQCIECECTECSQDYECNNCKCKNCFRYKCSSTNYPSSYLNLKLRIALRGQCFDEYEDCKRQAEEDGRP
ncbi:unnamed protein product, partial [Owenia fusiformis]